VFSLFASPLTASAGEDSPSELVLVPNGVVDGVDWSRARLNDALAGTAGPFDYEFPDTANKVRLYLIDTAVGDESGWIEANPKLTLLSSGQPSAPGAESSHFTHGTRVLSIIAGSATGAALGTPIDVINYDIFTDPETQVTSPSLLSDAISEVIATEARRPDDDPTRALICIALGSATEGDEAGLAFDIEDAVADGIPVLVSAGNAGGDAGDFVPSAYGSIDGVICVAASDGANQLLANSNSGDAVDLCAPGFQIPALDPDGGPATLTGTSAAVAFATAAAITELSMHPWFTPAQLETRLKSRAFPLAAGAPLVQVPRLDSDRDGVMDEVETFFGTDPESAASRGSFDVVGCKDGVLMVEFAIAETLFDPAAPLQLADGRSWRILASAGGKAWEPITVAEADGSVPGLEEPGTPVDGRVPLMFCADTVESQGLLRIEVMPAVGP